MSESLVALAFRSGKTRYAARRGTQESRGICARRRQSNQYRKTVILEPRSRSVRRLANIIGASPISRVSWIFLISAEQRQCEYRSDFTLHPIRYRLPLSRFLTPAVHYIFRWFARRSRSFRFVLSPLRVRHNSRAGGNMLVKLQSLGHENNTHL